MSDPAPLPLTAQPLSAEQRLALAAEALATYREACFWPLAPDFKVTAATLPLIVAGLRRHGNRAAFQPAARLCP